MATRRSSAATNEADNAFIYTVGVEVLTTVTRVRIHPSVRGIPPHTFDGCRDLIEVELNDNLHTIGTCAFENCVSLLRIKIPPNVTTIDNCAFRECTSLSVVELSEALLTIESGAFKNCTSLTSMKIPPNVTAICHEAFSGCKSLTDVELSKALVELGQCAFMNCTSLLRIKIPVNVTTIDNCAFRECTSLSVVELREALLTIGERAFKECFKLRTIEIPPNVTTIDEEAFEGCFNLREVQLNNVLNTLGPDAFSTCTSLAFIEIPASITIVSEATFYNCTSLKMAILNEGTTLIDEEAFRECSTLLGITIPSTINSIALDAFKGSTLLRNVSISPASSLTPEIFEQTFPTLSSMGISLDMIMHRFDELPLHKYCYDSYPTHAIQPVNNTSSEQFYQDVAQLPAHGLQQDCLGMTPLHILACSSNGQGVEVFQCMIEKYPNALGTKDVWGDVPLAYALYAEASIDVIYFLFKMHRQMWGNMPFDFANVIKELAARLVFPQYVRDVIRAQRTHFSGLRVDWQGIMESDDMNGSDTDIRMYRVLVEASVSSRYICMSEEHASIVDARVCEIRNEMDEDEDEDEDENDETSRIRFPHFFEEIRELVTNYAHLHHEYLLKVTTILELALWKAVILRSRNDNQELTRVECRADAGRCAEVVTKLVLTFL